VKFESELFCAGEYTHFPLHIPPGLNVGTRIRTFDIRIMMVNWIKIQSPQPKEKETFFTAIHQHEFSVLRIPILLYNTTHSGHGYRPTNTTKHWELAQRETMFISILQD
jgi:hypothetical protein